jgi:flagellar assembly protein FliH
MTKVIIKDSADAYRRWDIPVVEDVSAAVANAKQDKAPGLMTAEQIERIQAQAFKEAYDAGMQEGRQAGMAAGQAEIEKKSGMLDALLQSLAQPFQQLDDCVEQELVSLSLAIARQLVRRELKADPAQVMGVVHEAIAVLPVGSRGVKVCLHPEDVALVREIVASSEADRSWSLMEDPSLLRGDCRIVTETSQVDATLERRLAAIVSQLFGGERQQDAAQTEAPEQD